jgi:hypothetical protein
MDGGVRRVLVAFEDGTEVEAQRTMLKTAAGYREALQTRVGPRARYAGIAVNQREQEYRRGLRERHRDALPKR